MALDTTVGMTTGFNYQTRNLFNANPIQTNALNGVYTPEYESKTQIGPTRENLAKQQHEADMKALSAEIAAKETPQAKKERDESGFFSSRSQESELAAQKQQLQDMKDKNALEEAVKADKYFLIKSDWDRKVIMAANGETVTVQYEDKDGERDKAGNYPIKTLEITKSSKLRKISDERPKPKGKTAAQVKDEHWQRVLALREKYEPGMFDDKEDAKTKKIIWFDKFGRPLPKSNKVAVKEYQVELASLEEKRDRELNSIVSKASSEPASQGLNVEPHTIAIHAPGFCMNDGCCLELAFYTLRTAAKLIEDEAEALVDKELKDQIKENKAVHDELTAMYDELEKLNKEAEDKAGELAAADYQEAYRKYKTVVYDSNGNPLNASPKPDPADYTAERYLDNHPELLEDAMAHNDMITIKEMDVQTADEELAQARETALKKLTQEAKNYRLLLDHCTFQPTCPEWLEDAGNAVADGFKATGEAIADAAEWCWDGVSSAASWVADGGIGRTLDTVGGYINDGLAFVSDLQTKLNEVVGFEGICSLNPFGGTLGCSNCPMGSKCSSLKDTLLNKLKIANTTNDFLKNLKGALGLGDGQILGNLLKCAAALTGEVSGAINAVESFAIGTGAAAVLGGTADILNTNALPNWNTKIADCISVGNTFEQANDALDLINRTGSNPLSVMQSNVPGLDGSAIDISKLDSVSTGSTHFATMALGADKFNVVQKAKGVLNVEEPKGSTKYYDGKNVDIDSATQQMKKMKAAGLALA